MEVVEEPLVHNSIVEEVQVSVSDETVGIANDAEESHKSNGLDELAATANPDLAASADSAGPDLVNVDSTSAPEVMSVETTKSCEPTINETHITSEIVSEVVDSTTDTVNQQNIDKKPDNGLATKIDEEISELFVESTENVAHDDLQVSEECLIDNSTESKDMVQFKTEILVERNENDVNETDPTVVNSDELDASKHILSELRQNLELSDVLHSEVVDNMENNNGSTRQEVLNKEELLDILEGNDVDQADDQFVKIMQVDHSNIKTVEAQMALKQLTKLKSAKQKRVIERLPRKKKGEKRLSQNNSNSEIKTKMDKTSEASADESETNLDQNKGKKDKKTVSTSTKTLETNVPDSKTSKKDKKPSEISSGGEEMVPEEHAKSKKEKQISELTAGQIGSLPSEPKSKRTRKMVDNSLKLSESNSSENRGKKASTLTSKSNAEVSQDNDISESESNKPNNVKEIVNVLVRDWEDDDHEPLKDVITEKLLEETENLVNATEPPTVAQEIVIDQERIDGSSMDSSASFVSEGQAALNKSGDESQPQRRLGRVIKKKVIFDPDNPDTFTKGKLASRNKETISDKEQPTPKKSKIEVQHMPKAKSPPGKLHWKKPPPKASKQNKRLTEVDRLLMDEGAVNMIYQLTPEAPKGKKNMRTKAEFIKKIQSSTPETKEMKFRERKKESIKGEDAEAKKIAGGKQRGSLSGSVKSMSVCEDFEAHSADDSIIYRRHSSSSYSSNCMSPLRVNELDSAGAPGAARASRRPSDSQNLSIANEESVDQISDVFMSDVNTTSPNEVINKTDCLSIKQKLNSKLSHVLSKRKRESMKTDKPAKQKKLPKHDERREITVKSEVEPGLSKFKTLTVTFDNSLAEISVKRKGDQQQYNIQTLRELDTALAYVDRMQDIAVTLLTSECGTLCSSLDLSSILDDDMETRTTNAFSYAEAIRSLLSTAEQHSKLLCCGVWGLCSGVGLALAALSDVAVASEFARFALEDARAPLPLATVAFTSHIRRFPKPLLDTLVVFGHQLSASEALAGGLLSRVLWPVRIEDQLRQLARDIASRPSGGLLLKKQLLMLTRGEKTFQSCLEVERDLLADYWVSAEGQQLLRTALAAP